jgi:hypothetical protein
MGPTECFLLGRNLSFVIFLLFVYCLAMMGWAYSTNSSMSTGHAPILPQIHTCQEHRYRQERERGRKKKIIKKKYRERTLGVIVGHLVIHLPDELNQKSPCILGNSTVVFGDKELNPEIEMLELALQRHLPQLNCELLVCTSRPTTATKEISSCQK